MTREEAAKILHVFHETRKMLYQLEKINLGDGCAIDTFSTIDYVLYQRFKDIGLIGQEENINTFNSKEAHVFSEHFRYPFDKYADRGTLDGLVDIIFRVDLKIIERINDLHRLVPDRETQNAIDTELSKLMESRSVARD